MIKDEENSGGPDAEREPPPVRSESERRDGGTNRVQPKPGDRVIIVGYMMRGAVGTVESVGYGGQIIYVKLPGRLLDVYAVKDVKICSP
jgi:hypothetical protein